MKAIQPASQQWEKHADVISPNVQQSLWHCDTYTSKQERGGILASKPLTDLPLRALSRLDENIAPKIYPLIPWVRNKKNSVGFFNPTHTEWCKFDYDRFNLHGRRIMRPCIMHYRAFPQLPATGYPLPTTRVEYIFELEYPLTFRATLVLWKRMDRSISVFRNPGRWDDWFPRGISFDC